MKESILSKTRIALTWGDCGENHVGNQLVGKMQQSGTGITMEDLIGIQTDYLEHGGLAELKVFNIPEKCMTKCATGVLILRNFLNEEEQLAMMEELTSKTWDTKFLNTRNNTVQNKHARENLIFQRGVSQTAIYEEGKGTIENIENMPWLDYTDRKVREISRKIADTQTKTQDCELICEGNKYRTFSKKKERPTRYWFSW